MYCRKCGKELQDDWKLCPNCGTPVIDEKSDSADGTAKKDRPGKKMGKKGIFWLAAVFLIIAVGSIAVYLISSQEKPKEKTVAAEKKETDQTKPDPQEEQDAGLDFSGQDFSELLAKTPEEIEDMGLVKTQEDDCYTGLEGNLKVDFKEGQISEIQIMGDEKMAPSFQGIALGDTEEEAKSGLSNAYPETQDMEGGIRQLNLDTKGKVECILKDGIVSKIQYTRLSDEETQAIRNEKEEKLRAEYIFPDSDKKYLSEDEIRLKSLDEMMIGRNEIFARHGYIFTDENLKQHFENTSWYEGTIQAEQFNSDQIFNDFERKNVELIKQVENEINGVSQAEEEQQNAINEGYDFIVGNTYNYRGWQLAIEFQSSDTVRICYGGEIPDDYFNYSITARYEENKGGKSWLKYININGVEYYLRCFTDGSINLSGPGEFDGWYDLV